MTVRSTVNLEITGGAVGFTLADLEKFVHDARDLGMAVNASVYITHSEGDRPGESGSYTLRASGPRQSASEARSATIPPPGTFGVHDR